MGATLGNFRIFCCSAFLFFCFLAAPCFAAPPAAPPTFRKHIIDADLPGIAAVAMDVDGDGKLDVVAAGGPSGGASAYSGQLYWYRAPHWEKRLIIDLALYVPEGERSIILHIDRVNFLDAPADGEAPLPQFTVCDGRQGTVWWFRYDREAEHWRADVIVEKTPNVHGSAAGDIDGDGYDDLLVAHRNQIGWYRNPGPNAAAEAQFKVNEQTIPYRIQEPSRGLWQRHELVEGRPVIEGHAHYMRLADLTGDGKLEALLGSSKPSGGWFACWAQGDDPTEPWQLHHLPGPMRGGTNIEVADLNADGRADIVASEGHGTGLWWFAAHDFQPVRIDDQLQSAHCLAIGDFNADGRPDIATVGYGSRTAAIFLNRGEGQFDRVVLDEDQAAYDVRAVDLNGDGRLDLLVAGQHSGNVVWYEQQ